MKKLSFHSLKSKKALWQLSTAEKRVNLFLEKHPDNLKKHQHAVLRRLLKKRAKAMSKATGFPIHSIFD